MSSLFQKSIFNSIKQDETIIAQRWANYQAYLTKIEFVSDVKEENYQEGFLRDVFENCLGYTLNTTNHKAYNLEREKKNETDSKKADAVISVKGEIVGVIELKGQNTSDLDKKQSKDKLSTIDQAFGYLVSHTNARYVIVSNFDALRFYIDKKTSYEGFNLFTLSYEAFQKLHLLLSYESISHNIPLQLKEKSAHFEKEISTKLYKDFSQFRTHLFENLIKNNRLEKPLLLRLTQKLCDRIIFILFAEDRGLLNANTINEIRQEFKEQKRTNFRLYDIYKFYFNDIDKGNETLKIPKYNGGLFAEDTLLDSLIIDDTVLDREVQILSDYDFASDISVNILGHIFEQSLTDLEELNATIHEIDFDKKQGKRKKTVFSIPLNISPNIS